MNSESTIRAYKNTDKKDVLHLLRLNTPEYFLPKEEKDLIFYLENEIDQYFVIEVNGQIVGSGGINFRGDKITGIISWDIIHPEFQGKSLGRKLLLYRIEKLLQIKNIQKIKVRTTQLAYKFYEKSGFKLIATVDDYWAKDFHLYEMEYSA